MPHLLDGVEVAGPFNPTGVSKTPSRALIFVCDPKKTGEPACARQITENLARRAFRRPVTTEDMNRLMPFYEAERRDGGTFDQGIEQIVAAVLASPAVSVSQHSRAQGRHARHASSLSPIWNWLPGFPSSCGTPARTRNC